MRNCINPQSMLSAHGSEFIEADYTAPSLSICKTSAFLSSSMQCSESICATLSLWIRFSILTRGTMHNWTVSFPGYFGATQSETLWGATKDHHLHCRVRVRTKEQFRRHWLNFDPEIELHEPTATNTLRTLWVDELERLNTLHETRIKLSESERSGCYIPSPVNVARGVCTWNVLDLTHIRRRHESAILGDVGRFNSIL